MSRIPPLSRSRATAAVFPRPRRKCQHPSQTVPHPAALFHETLSPSVHSLNPIAKAMMNSNYQEDVLRPRGAYPTVLQVRNHPLRASPPGTEVLVFVTESRWNTATGSEKGRTDDRRPSAMIHPWSAPHHDIEDMLELGSRAAVFVRQLREDRPEDDVCLFFV